MAATMTAAVRATGPLGLMRPVPRGSGVTRRAFGHQRAADRPTRPTGGGGRATVGTEPAGCPGRGWDAGAAAQVLYRELRRLGLRRVYGSADPKVSVLSLPGGVTVWVRGGVFTWRDAEGRTVWWSADDAVGAARRLLAEVQAR